MFVVDSLLLYRGARGSRYQLGQRQVYETFATQLIHNAFTVHNLRYRGSLNDTPTGQVVQSYLTSGIGIHLSPTRERGKSRNGEVYTFAM